jgi:TolA-binding protein
MRRDSFWKIFLAIIFFINFTLYLPAQSGRGRLFGNVVDESGNPVAGAKITGYNETHNIKFETHSNEKGKWIKSGLRGGGWRITAIAEGFMRDTVNIQMQQLGRNPSVDFTLKKIKIKTDMPFLKDESSANLFQEGNTFHEQKKYDEAIAAFKLFLEKNPTIHQVRINIGNCYKDKGEYDKAIQEYNLVLDAIEMKKGNLEGDISAGKALANIGECYLKKGDMETAHKFLKEAIDNYPEDESLAYNVGELFFSSRQMEEAAKYFELAKNINPEWSEPYLKLGYTYSNLTHYEKAIQNFTKFLDLEPDSPQASEIRNIIDTLEKLKK